MTPLKSKTKAKLFDTKEVPETMFVLVKKGNEVKIVIKDQIVSKYTFKTYEEAEEYIESKPYELICISSYFYTEHMRNMLQDKQIYRENNNSQNNNQN